jgi:predicted transcriptional regulator
MDQEGDARMTDTAFHAYARLLQQLDSLLETLEVMADDAAMAAIKASEADMAAGWVVPWEQVKQELGLDD